MHKTTFSPYSMDKTVSISDIVSIDVFEFQKLCPKKEELASFILNHPSIKKLEQISGFRPSDDELYLECLTHTSFQNEFKNIGIICNERLEFIGDSVLALLVTEKLLFDFPNFNEGKLSRFRSSIVNEQSFAKMGISLNLGHCLLLGKGEVKSLGYKKDALLADFFEAYLGMVFVDSGFETSKKVFLNFTKLYFDQTQNEFINTSNLMDFDSKTKLQEITMNLYKNLPEYRFNEIDDQTFEVDVIINGKSALKGQGISKKKLEKKLAKKILDKHLY